MKPQEFTLKVRPIRSGGRICCALSCMNPATLYVRQGRLAYWGKASTSIRFFCDSHAPQKEKVSA